MRVWSGAWSRLLLASIAFCSLLLQVSNIKAAQNIPAQISSETLRTIISDFSESDVASDYRSNNFVSNELYYQTVIPMVQSRTTQGGVYIGVGPEQNFTYIAAFRPRIAFIIDIRRQNMLELLMYKALFEMATTNRADFVALLFSRKRPAALGDSTAVDDLLARFENISPDDGLYKATLAAIENRLINEHKLALDNEDVLAIRRIFMEFRDNGIAININGGPSSRTGETGITFQHLMIAGDTQGLQNSGSRHSFLSTEDDYRFVRSMQQKNLIIPLIGDFGGSKTIRAVGSYARDHAAIVNVFYISNVVTGYLDKKHFEEFVDSVRTLPLDNSSTFIRGADRPALGMDRVPPGLLRGMFSSFAPIQEVLEEIRLGNIRIPADMNRVSR